MYSYGSPHMAAQKQDDQLERTFSSYVRIQDVVLKTYLGRWTIGRSGERGLGISVLPARYDDDDDDDDDELDIKLDPFTQEELDSVLRNIKNRKAAGLDEIPPEVWKTRELDDILLRHCNAVYFQNPIDRWMKGCILPFPRYNTYIHSSENLKCPTRKPHTTQNWKHS